jgi:hypothetical protein
VDQWEASLKTAGGAIMPEKTFWFMVEFAWTSGHWRYKTSSECPGTLSVKDIHGNRMIHRRYEVHKTQEMLSFFLAPDGNHKAQTAKMVQAANKWADAMQTGTISRSEVKTSLISTIWHTLIYPLLALNPSKADCEKIMAPILQYCLPAMGYCRNFPQDIVFCPAKYMGVNILHLYTLQEILRIKGIIYHTTYNTGTGSFYRISLELLLIELGMDTDLSLISYERFSALATPSLVKSTWQFQYEKNFRLQHNISLPVP